MTTRSCSIRSKHTAKGRFPRFDASRRRLTSDGPRLFFFFQAEDGIRDYKVTGIQTCALPISPPPNPLRPSFVLTDAPPTPKMGFDLIGGCSSVGRALGCGPRGRGFKPRQPPRSEERRVGKECRSRWSPYH